MTSANLKLCEKAWEVRREKRSKLVQLFKNLTTSNKDVMLGLQHVVALDNSLQYIAVAPPRGVRGLKSTRPRHGLTLSVAPPRGVRGLKYQER